MAGAKAYLPVTNDSSAGYYNVQFRIQGTTTYQTMQPRSPLPQVSHGSPATLQSVIIFPKLLAGQTYEAIVQRFCGDGTYSNPISTTFTTATS